MTRIVNANRTLINQESAMVRPMSPLSFGTILKSWRGSKGLDYITVGINTDRKEIYAIKANCINEDGTVHASVRRHKRVFKYTVTPSGQFGIIKGITSVLGQKQYLDPEILDQFNRRVDDTISVTSFNTIRLYTQPLIDRRKSSIYA